MLALFIDVLSGCRGYKFMGLQLSRVMGMGISELLMTWVIGVVPRLLGLSLCRGEGIVSGRG